MDFQVAGRGKGRIRSSVSHQAWLKNGRPASGSRFLAIVGGALLFSTVGIAQETPQNNAPTGNAHAPGTRWVENVPLGAPIPYQDQDSVPYQAPAPLAAPAPFQAPLPVPSTTYGSNAAPRPASRPLPTEDSVINLNFQNAPVAEILSMIADQSGLNIIVNGDVSGTIPNVNLREVTPEAAIRTVSMAAGIEWRKTSDGVYVIARNLPPEVKVDSKTLPREIPIAPYDGSGSVTYTQMPDLSTIPQLSPTTLSAPQINEKREYFSLPVKNVPIRVMAWLIDPQHQPMPISYAQSQQNSSRYFEQYLGKSFLSPQDMAAQNGGYAQSDEPYNPYAPVNNMGSSYDYNNYGGQYTSPYTQGNAQFGGFGNQGGGRNQGGRNQGGRNQGGRNQGGRNQGGFGGGGGGGLFELPEGVEQIISVDPQNALLVYATQQGYQELQNIVNLLDRPLRQVEIEAQFVTVNATDTNAFGIDFTSLNGPFTVSGQGFQPGTASVGGSFQLGFVRNNFQAVLRSLLVNNRAKLVNSPRVTAINNLTATLQSQQSTPVITTSAQAGIGGQVAQQQNVNYITTSIGLTVTPTINNDGTITVVMQPQVQDQQANPGGIAPTITSQSVQTVANLRDGDTIVLGGLRKKTIARLTSEVPILSKIPLIGKLFRSRNDVSSDADLIIFLTARVLPRFEEDAVPGT